MHSCDTRREMSLARITMLLIVIVPFVGLIGGIILLWGRGFGGVQLATFLGMYLVTTLGVTVGYHRLFTHRSFDTIWPIKLILGVVGSMAVEGPLLKWVATHRLHHSHSDMDGDPHSPHQSGSGVLATLRGFWHAHVGWMLAAESPGLSRYIRDLIGDRLLRTTSRLFPLWVLASLLIPTLLGGLLTWTWFGALAGFLWGGLARIFLVHHLTFSINSVCHLWGRRPFRTRDHSRNNLVFGVIGFGGPGMMGHGGPGMMGRGGPGAMDGGMGARMQAPCPALVSSWDFRTSSRGLRSSTGRISTPAAPRSPA